VRGGTVCILILRIKIRMSLLCIIILRIQIRRQLGVNKPLPSQLGGEGVFIIIYNKNNNNCEGEGGRRGRI